MFVSSTTNDGGCVNDEQLRDFMNLHAVIPHTGNSEYCSEKEDGTTDCDSPNWYRAPVEFTVSVMNTAFMGSVRGIRVLQQILPHQPSTIKVSV